MLKNQAIYAMLLCFLLLAIVLWIQYYYAWNLISD